MSFAFELVVVGMLLLAASALAFVAGYCLGRSCEKRAHRSLVQKVRVHTMVSTEGEKTMLHMSKDCSKLKGHVLPVRTRPCCSVCCNVAKLVEV